MKPMPFAMTAPCLLGGALVVVRGSTDSKLGHGGAVVEIEIPTADGRESCYLTLEAFGSLVRAARNAGWSQ